MADKRMFSRFVVSTDRFKTLPLSSQALYFHFGMNADDDGFVDSPKSIQRSVGASDDDIKLLIAKEFIIPFESGIIVITHWNLNNNLRKDTYHRTIYQDEFKLLEQKYQGLYITNSLQVRNETVTDSYENETQNRIEKNSKEKDSKDKKNENSCDSDESLSFSFPKNSSSKRFLKPTLEEIRSYCEERKNSVNAEIFFDYYESNGWKVGKNPMKDWKASVRTWERKGTFKQNGSSKKAAISLDENFDDEKLLKSIGVL